MLSIQSCRNNICPMSYRSIDITIPKGKW